ncbi:MAG: nitroreductase family protein [Bacteroidales bacterium]|nr:nitroreductase family protein [Bacteroidales bacterium]MBN2749683.1 nitroreductase family protein [Bacteroidales bacterium]
MELRKAIETRTSVRQFTSEPVAKSDLQEMVRLASLAPSVNNYQPWSFVVVTNKELLRRMADAVREKIHALPENSSRMSRVVKKQVEFFATFFENAPALVVIATQEYETILEKGVTLTHAEINEMRNSPDIQSVGGCAQNLLLAAMDMGYGACWMSAPLIAKKELEAILALDSTLNLMSFIAVGKPLRQQLPREKRPVEELIRFVE